VKEEQEDNTDIYLKSLLLKYLLLSRKENQVLGHIERYFCSSQNNCSLKASFILKNNSEEMDRLLKSFLKNHSYLWYLLSEDIKLP
jgi:hypothetical protein